MFENVPELFKSKRFWSAVFYVLILSVSAFNDELGKAIDIEQLTLIFGILIGGYSLVDYAEAKSDNKPE